MGECPDRKMARCLESLSYSHLPLDAAVGSIEWTARGHFDDHEVEQIHSHRAADAANDLARAAGERGPRRARPCHPGIVEPYKINRHAAVPELAMQDAGQRRTDLNVGDEQPAAELVPEDAALSACRAGHAFRRIGRADTVAMHKLWMAGVELDEPRVFTARTVASVVPGPDADRDRAYRHDVSPPVGQHGGVVDRALAASQFES